tara:strand:+ start:926 stop:1105 length:180 start_codon:yes stop_codon:yes gene_type:complete
MSGLVKPSQKTQWSIQETEFLIRLLMSSKVDGADIEIAYEVIRKIKALHTKIVENKIDG